MAMKIRANNNPIAEQMMKAKLNPPMWSNISVTCYDLSATNSMFASLHALELLTVGLT